MIISKNINEEKIIELWSQTKWLVLYSFFFIIPANYAFINNILILKGF